MSTFHSSCSTVHTYRVSRVMHTSRCCLKALCTNTTCTLLNAGLTELTEAGWSRPTCGFSYQPPASSPADIRQLGMHGSLFSKTNKEMEKLLCKEPPNENEKPIHTDSRDLVLWLCAMFCTWLILCYEEHNFFHITKSRLLSCIFTVFLFLPLLSKTWVKSDDLDHSETQTYIICYCV